MQLAADRPDLACEVTDYQSVLRAWIPGIARDQLRVALHGDRLTIWSTTKDPSAASTNTFCRSVRLTNSVSLAGATMEYQDGELTVTLPHTRGRLKTPG